MDAFNVALHNGFTNEKNKRNEDIKQSKISHRLNRCIDWAKCRTALKMNSSWSFVWGVAISHFSSVIYVKRMLLWFFFIHVYVCVSVYGKPYFTRGSFSFSFGCALKSLSALVTRFELFYHCIALHYLLGHNLWLGICMLGNAMNVECTTRYFEVVFYLNSKCVRWKVMYGNRSYI